MCGILGSVNVPDIESRLHLISHRGPDSKGNINLSNSLHQVSLSHARLSIVDLSEAGHQPMMCNDNTGCIVFNGEIYNHECLKKDLPDITFKGHSDTETIVNHFRQFGVINTLNKLNGIFAIVYFDITRQRLYLARDRYGVKPLYYTFQKNQLLFSSEIRPLKNAVSNTCNEGAIMHCLSMRFSPAPLTIYNGIEKVEPGQVITIDLLAPELKIEKKYFVASPQNIGHRNGDMEALVKEYGDLFIKAVKRQLMADVEVGVLLSGGIDSALVAAVAKQASILPIKAFTIGFENGEHEFDEVNNAAETARVLGLDHFFQRIQFSDFLASFKEIVNIVEEPIGTTSIIPMYELSRLAASKVKVVLSGQGADEPLGGYKKYRGLAILEKMKSNKTLPRLTKWLSPFYKRQEKLYRLFTALQAETTLDSYFAYNEIFSLAQVKHMLNDNRQEEVLAKYHLQRSTIREVLEKRMPSNISFQDFFPYYDLRTSLADDLLMYTDKITMHFSMECRVPMLDNDLVDFIESLQTRYKFNANHGKIIHKKFARAYLPDAIIRRKKLGFQSPTALWFRQHQSQLKTLLGSEKQFGRLFNLQSIYALIDAHSKGANYEKQIFLLLSIFFLMEAEYDQQQN